jgi:hypothetical protein
VVGEVKKLTVSKKFLKRSHFTGRKGVLPGRLPSSFPFHFLLALIVSERGRWRKEK